MLNYPLVRDMLLSSLRNRGVKSPAKDYPLLADCEAQAEQIAAMRAQRDAIDIASPAYQQAHRA